MHRLRWLVARARALFRSAELDADFAQELDAHLTMLADDYVRAGLPRDEAERAARRRLGAGGALAARHRDARGLPALDDLWQDVRFALRLARKEWAFTAAAVAALAIGIGANTFGFSVVHAAFFRGLPFPESDRLVRAGWRRGSDSIGSLSHADFLAWRNAAQSVDLAAISEAPINISDEAAAPQQVRGAWVSANLFRILRQPVLLGRDFAPDEDTPGRADVVIIGHRLWSGRFLADPSVLGRTLRLNGRPATIVGVMPPGMHFFDNAELWAPLAGAIVEPDASPPMFEVIGRLHAGVSLAGAEAELTPIARQHAPPAAAGSEPRSARLFALTVDGAARGVLQTVMVVGTLVLLIACANVANLLLSRTPYRAQEIALRVALGATRARVVRLLLLESLVVAGLGAGLGFMVAVAATSAFESAVRDVGKPYWLVFTTEPIVLVYVVLVCGMTSLLFGLGPALQVSRANAHEMLKDGGRTSTDGARVRLFSSALVVLQLTLTMALLGGAGLVVRGFMTLYRMDLGIAADRLTIVHVELPDRAYPDAAARWAFFSRVRDRVANTAGVEAVALVNGVPPLDGGERMARAEGRPDRPPRFVSTVTISPEFFGAVQRPVLRGRQFDDRDGRPGAETVIVNEQFAALFFPGEEPLGRRIRLTSQDEAQEPGEPWRTIVGVSPPIRHGSAQDAHRNAVVYVPFAQDTPAAATLLLRSGSTAELLGDVVRRAVQAEDADQPVREAESLQQAVASHRWAQRVFGGLFTILAVASLVLSGVGLYAVVAYSVSRRRQEIGVRMAIGADRLGISWMILRRGLLQLAVGLPAGLAGVVALGVVLETLLVETTPADPMTLVIITGILIGVATAACLIPASRATRVNPVDALRQE